MKRQFDLLWLDFKETAFNDCKPSLITKMRFFNEIERYFIGLFKIKTKSKLQDFENEFFQYLVRYGELFVTKINNEIQLWQVHQKYNKGIKVHKVKVSLIEENNKYYNQYSKQITLINNKQGIYVKWKPQPTPLIMEAYDFINDQFNAYKLFINALITDNKKFIYTTNNNDTDTANKELESILDVNKPYIININPLSQNKHHIQNKITPLEFGHDQANQAFINLTNIRNFWKDILGMVTPTDNKKERKNLSETHSENYNSENTEIMILRNLNNFAKQWNQLYNENLQFEESQELKEITEDAQQK